jgi:hypothetical protein
MQRLGDANCTIEVDTATNFRKTCNVDNANFLGHPVQCRWRSVALSNVDRVLTASLSGATLLAYITC